LVSDPKSVLFEFVPLGWDRREWNGSFFPDDLPRDWRLAFFASALQGVALAPRSWVSVPIRRIERWAGEVGPRFRFYPLLASRAPADLESRLSAFGARLGGVVTAKRRLSAVPPHLPAYPLIRPDPSGERSGELTPAVVLPTFRLGGLRDQRRWLETLADSFPDGARVLVILGGAPPDLRILHQLDEVARLMGLA